MHAVLGLSPDSRPGSVDNGGGQQEAPIYQMAKGMATVPDRLVNATIEAADDCPGECIFIEVV